MVGAQWKTSVLLEHLLMDFTNQYSIPTIFHKMFRVSLLSMNRSPGITNHVMNTCNLVRKIHTEVKRRSGVNRENARRWRLQSCNWWDFAGGRMNKNLPDSAGDMSLIPGLKRSHMPRSNKAHAPLLLSPHTTTTEACPP